MLIVVVMLVRPDGMINRALGVDRLFGGKGGQGSRGPQASAETKTKEAAHHA